MRPLRLLLKMPAFVTGFLVGVIAGVVLVANFAWHGLRWSTDLLDQLLRRETIDRFETEAVRITGKQSLNVARLEATEVFERTEKTQALWVSLPDVIVRARLPVQYNYSVSVSREWHFSRDGDTLVVRVPELGSARPAVDVSAMKLDVVKGSLFRGDEAAKRELQNELTDWLNDRAVAHRADVREEARRSIESFVRTWAKRETGSELATPVRVEFPGEDERGLK